MPPPRRSAAHAGQTLSGEGGREYSQAWQMQSPPLPCQGERYYTPTVPPSAPSKTSWAWCCITGVLSVQQPLHKGRGPLHTHGASTGMGDISTTINPLWGIRGGILGETWLGHGAGGRLIELECLAAETGTQTGVLTSILRRQVHHPLLLLPTDAATQSSCPENELAQPCTTLPR